MRRTPFSIALIASGFVLLVGMTLWTGHGTAPAEAHSQLPRTKQDTAHVQAPSPTLPPRPTLSPTPAPGGGSGRGSGGGSSTPANGRITGTVINLTTGAPAPGIAVAVGDMTVTTDANGNYDRPGLPAGSYVVALALTAGQGVPAQNPINVNLAADATVVQHLAFRSQPAATATPVASPTPAAPPPQTLPNTGAGSGGSGLPLGTALGLAMIVIGAAVWRTARRHGRA